MFTFRCNYQILRHSLQITTLLPPTAFPAISLIRTPIFSLTKIVYEIPAFTATGTD